MSFSSGRIFACAPEPHGKPLDQSTVREDSAVQTGGQLLLNSFDHFGAEEVSLHPIAEYLTHKPPLSTPPLNGPPDLVHCVDRVLRSSGRAGNSLSDLADVRAESVDQTVDTVMTHASRSMLPARARSASGPFERGAFADRIDNVEQDDSVTICASLRGDSLRAQNRQLMQTQQRLGSYLRYSASHLERVRTHRHFGDRFDGILGVSKLGEFGLEVTQ